MNDSFTILPDGAELRAREEEALPIRRVLIFVALPVITATISMAGVLVLLIYFEVGSRMASRLTREGLERLRPGMDEQTVIATIGAPLWEHHYRGKDVGTQFAQDPSEMVWQYAEPGFVDSGFAIYVTFENHVVKATEIKHDDFTVFTCTAWKCPNVIGNATVLSRLPRGRR